MKNFLTTAKAENLIISDIIHIEKSWIDYNGHLNAGYYNLIFDRAGEKAFATFGLGPQYAKARAHTIYTAEVHLCYLREVHIESPLCTATQIVGYDKKRIHVFQYLCHANEGWVAATNEVMFLHIDMSGPKVAEFPNDIFMQIEKIAAKQTAGLPQNLGKIISMKKK